MFRWYKCHAGKILIVLLVGLGFGPSNSGMAFFYGSYPMFVGPYRVFYPVPLWVTFIVWLVRVVRDKRRDR